MTWSVTHTIPYTSNADNHAAMLYLFDTVLGGKTGWTVQAHPDSSAYKRKLKYTVHNKVTNSPYTMYSWVNWWSATSPTSLTWYEDATYTTTPGDTSTDLTSGYDSNGVSWTVAGENWRFCTSNVNDQSVLVLKGNRLAFYWPGISSGIFWADPAWLAGSNDNRGTWVGPVVGSNPNNLLFANAPATSGTNANEYALIPDMGYPPSLTVQGFRGNYIATNFNWLYTQTANVPSPDLSSSTAFANGGHTDIGVWLPSNLLNQVDARTPFSPSSGISLKIGSSYWFNTWTDLGKQGVIFDFGAVDPIV